MPVYPVIQARIRDFQPLSFVMPVNRGHYKTSSMPPAVLTVRQGHSSPPRDGHWRHARRAVPACSRQPLVQTKSLHAHFARRVISRQA